MKTISPKQIPLKDPSLTHNFANERSIFLLITNKINFLSRKPKNVSQRKTCEGSGLHEAS